jgi:Tol biopolymer transport system component
MGPDANFPSFSPDGTKIVFLCGWETLYGNICVMNADGSDRRQLTHDGDDGLRMDETSNDEPAWSPDGRSIMFDSTRVDPNLGHPAELTWVMNADGSNQRILLPHLYGEGRNPWIK